MTSMGQKKGRTNISDICTCIPMHRYGYRLHVSDNRNMQIYFLVVLVCYPGVGAPVVSSSSRLVLGIQIHGKSSLGS